MREGRVSVQTLEQREADLERLRDAVDRELDRVQRAIREQPRRRYAPTPPACGTERGYQRHYYRGEPIDDDCAEAHRVHNRVRERRAS